MNLLRRRKPAIGQVIQHQHGWYFGSCIECGQKEYVFRLEDGSHVWLEGYVFINEDDLMSVRWKVSPLEDA